MSNPDITPSPDHPANPPVSRTQPRRNAASPALRQRQDGWTPEKQTQFLGALSATGSVSAAAAACGMSRNSAYRLRARPQAVDFRTGWDDAMRSAVNILAATALERAIHGVRETVWHRGQAVGERVRYNDRLLMFMLRNHSIEAPGPQAEKHEIPAFEAAARTDQIEQRITPTALLAAPVAKDAPHVLPLSPLGDGPHCPIGKGD